MVVRPRGICSPPGVGYDRAVKIVRHRHERFGAIVATEDPAALVSVDRTLARRLGLGDSPLWSEAGDGGLPLTGPTEVHLAVTGRCSAGCTACYADATPDGHEPSLAELKKRIDVLAQLGAFTVAFGGGEGTLRDDLPELARHARASGLVPTLTTSGLGLTRQKATSLIDLAQVNVSHDGPNYAAVRGYDGGPRAAKVVRWLRDAGIPVWINAVLTRESFPVLSETAELAETMGAVELQLLRLKPTGRAKLDYLARRLSRPQRELLPGAIERLSRERSLTIRIDCALVPFLAARVSPDRLAAFGVMGCEPGNALLTVKPTGQVAPCSFWDSPGGRLGPDAWDDPSLAGFRSFRASPPAPCDTCPHQRICGGGCKVVAARLGDDAFAPDPECPRVEAHARATRATSRE